MLALDPLAYDLRASLVTLVARVLHYGPSRTYAPSPWPLPTSRPDLWFEDDVQSLQHVLRQGVPYAFAYHAAGWRERTILAGDEAWAATPRCARLWDFTPPLRYSEAAPDLALGLYNLVARRPRSAAGPLVALHTPELEARRLLDLDTSASGDGALLYWLATGLWAELDPALGGERVKGTAELYAQTAADLALKHPLLALRFAPFNAPEKPTQDLAPILRSPLRPWLPWWIAHALAYWHTRQGAIWKAEPARFTAIRKRQAALLRHWLHAATASGWLDLIPPILEHLAQELLALRHLARKIASAADPDSDDLDPRPRYDDPDLLARSAVAWLDRTFKDRRYAERAELRAAWAEIYGVAAPLRDAHALVSRKHPVDREDHERWFLSWWAEVDAPRLIDDLDAVSRAIEGRLG